MANAYKVLGQANPGAVLTDLYTVPASTEAIAFLTVSNKASAAKTCRVKVAPAGAADDDDHNVLYDFTVPANDTYVHPKALYLATTDKVRVYGESTDLTFSLDGVEIS